MANTQNTSPSLDDLLGGSSEIHSIVPKKSSPENSSKALSSETSLESLLGDRGNGSAQKSDASDISLDDLLGTDTPKKTEDLHFSDMQEHPEKVHRDEEGNIFQKAFEDEGIEKEEHITDAIENFHIDVSESLDEPREEDPFILMRQKEEESFEREKKQWRTFLIATQAFGVFAGVFAIASFFIFSFLLDTPEKGVLGNIISGNYGIERDDKTEQDETLTSEIRALKKDISLNEKTIEGLRNNTVLDSIISDRIHWLEAIDRIMEVRKDANPTEGGQSIFFENYSTKGGSGNFVEILISGKVYSSQSVFQKISKLTETFNNSEFFSGAQVRRFNRTDDGRQYYMPFSFRLKYFQEGKFHAAPDTQKK